MVPALKMRTLAADTNQGQLNIILHRMEKAHQGENGRNSSNEEATWKVWGLPEEVRLEPWVISEFLRKKGLEVALVVKNPPANAGDTGDVGLIPGSGRSAGGGNDNLLQYSCLENPMDRGAWQATMYGVAKSQTLLK